jgi:hypothetical protein
MTPDEARVKIAKDALATKQQELGAPLTADQEWEVLRQLGTDVYSTYYQHTEATTDQSSSKMVSITQSVSIRIPYGAATLPAGIKLEFVSRNGPEVRVRYMGAEYTIPVSATDLK